MATQPSPIFEIPRTAEVEMLEDAQAIRLELITAARILRFLLVEPAAPAETIEDDIRQALFLQAVVLLCRSVKGPTDMIDGARRNPLPSSIFDEVENGPEAWAGVKWLRNKMLVHDDHRGYRFTAGAVRSNVDCLPEKIGFLKVCAAFGCEPGWISMLEEMVSHARHAIEERIPALALTVTAQLVDWKQDDALEVTAVAPPHPNFQGGR